MFNFCCYSCGENFRISFENLFNKIAIQCPNCNNHLPEKAVHSLRLLSESYMDVIDILYHSNSNETGFGLSIQGTEKAIPEKPDKYFHRKISENESFWRHRNKPYDQENKELKKQLEDDPDFPF